MSQHSLPAPDPLTRWLLGLAALLSILAFAGCGEARRQNLADQRAGIEALRLDVGELAEAGAIDARISARLRTTLDAVEALGFALAGGPKADALPAPKRSPAAIREDPHGYLADAVRAQREAERGIWGIIGAVSAGLLGLLGGPGLGLVARAFPQAAPIVRLVQAWLPGRTGPQALDAAEHAVDVSRVLVDQIEGLLARLRSISPPDAAAAIAELKSGQTEAGLREDVRMIRAEVLAAHDAPQDHA